MDINFADCNGDICTLATEVEDRRHVQNSAATHGHEDEASDLSLAAEAAIPAPLLWECLHRQYSKSVVADMLRCKAELLWHDPDPQPVCAAESMQHQQAERSLAGTRDSTSWTAILSVLVVFVAAQVTMAIVIWRCAVRSAAGSVSAIAAADMKHMECLNGSRHKPEAGALARPVHSSGAS